MSTIPTAMPAFAPVPSPPESVFDAGCEFVEVSVALFDDVGAVAEFAVEKAGAELRLVLIALDAEGIAADISAEEITALGIASVALAGVPAIAEDASAKTEDASPATAKLVN